MVRAGEVRVEVPQSAAPTPILGAGRRLMVRKELPPGCSIKAVVVRELISADDLEAALALDMNASQAVKDNERAFSIALLQEKIRLSLVEVTELGGKRRRVNVMGEPVTEMDRWSSKTMRIVERVFFELNGIKPEEEEDFQRGLEPVDERQLAAPSVVADSTGAIEPPSRG